MDKPFDHSKKFAIGRMSLARGNYGEITVAGAITPD
jgi:hypothetical protein